MDIVAHRDLGGGKQRSGLVSLVHPLGLLPALVMAQQLKDKNNPELGSSFLRSTEVPTCREEKWVGGWGDCK
jgi:hypothetical protein